MPFILQDFDKMEPKEFKMNFKQGVWEANLKVKGEEIQIGLERYLLRIVHSDSNP